LRDASRNLSRHLDVRVLHRPMAVRGVSPARQRVPVRCREARFPSPDSEVLRVRNQAL